MPAIPEGLVTGLTASRSLLVEGSKLYSPTGLDEDAVLSSPSMIMEMELACVEAVGSIVGASAGFHVDVKHVAPAARGSTVETTATLTEIDGIKLRFKVETRLDGELIGLGTHRRAIVHS